MVHDAALVILVGWAAGALAGPLTVSRIDTAVSPENKRLRLVSGLLPGDLLDEEALDRASARIASQLADAGYLSVQVDADTSVHGDSVAVSFRIQTGQPARIGGWRISADSGVSAEKLTRLLPGRGTRFGKAVVDRAAASLLSVCGNNGYPFAVVTPRALVQESGFVYPEFQVETGPKVQIGYLEFAGKPVTKPELLERVAGFSRGDYSATAAAQWRHSLEQSGLAVVDSQAIVSDPRGYGVRFWVTGRRVNTASGVAGYSPADKRLTGLAQISFHNLFDSGRRLEAGWQSAYGRTGYRVSYTEPWVLGTPVDVTASAWQQTIDTTSARTDLALAAEARAAVWTTVSLETGYDRFIDVPSRASADVAWAGTGVVLDSRDFPANPRSGVRLSAFTRVGNRATDSAGSAVVTHV
ncbi:hypothetical protein JXD38_00700, partial [candidate division WOR-3 bacterium]|nr:hypothetical protein [candidate division WOR-3 bacterium]